MTTNQSLPVAPSAPFDSSTGASSLLSKDQANTLLRRDVANLVKKVAGGKTMTTAELARVQAVAEGSSISKAWADDQTELAEVLGVTRMTVQRWRKAGAPPPKSNGKWSVVAWREWMNANGKEAGKQEETGASRQQLEAKRLILQNEKLETEIGILRSEYVPMSEVDETITLLVREARKVGESMPASLAPQVVGLSVAEAEKRLRAWWDEYCLALHTGKSESPK